MVQVVQSAEEGDEMSEMIGSRPGVCTLVAFWTSCASSALSMLSASSRSDLPSSPYTTYKRNFSFRIEGADRIYTFKAKLRLQAQTQITIVQSSKSKQDSNSRTKFHPKNSTIAYTPSAPPKRWLAEFQAPTSSSQILLVKSSATVCDHYLR